jgi:hypothetical protein
LCKYLATQAAAHGPSSYLLQELERVEGLEHEAQNELADTRSQLQARTAELQACKSKLALMQHDLQVRLDPLCACSGNTEV